MLVIPRRQKILTAWLPPTACTPEMRGRMEKLAKSQDVKLSELQRAAFEFFLQKSESQTISDESLHIILSNGETCNEPA